MAFLKNIIIRNFRCIRQEMSINLTQSSYLVGPNNAGKTAVLSAIKCFFDHTPFKSSDLNKTEFSAKKEGFNKTDISIEFDLTLAPGKARKQRLKKAYGDSLIITRSFIFREATQTIITEYKIDKKTFPFFDSIDQDAQEIIKAVSLSYIHPQEGDELLQKAQEKFKKRLFYNWGRHSSIAGQLAELQDKWEELRKTANSYLSATLTENLKQIWPHSSTKVDLPARIEEIVAVSDISFRSAPSLPEVTLTSQGTGAQSIVLYQTHYILDSDRTLHQGFYYPVWLLEEPESFLHGDVAIKLSKLLNSDEWIKSIQMIISTHSPIMLAASHHNAGQANWVLLENHAIGLQKPVSEITDEDITRFGKIMGDPNFDAYFAASNKEKLIFIEDIRPLSKIKLEEAGLSVTEALNGSSVIKKYIDVFSSVSGILSQKAFFLLDNDSGKSDFSSYLKAEKIIRSESNFTLYEVGNGAFILLFPPDCAFEDLFNEFTDAVDDCVREIYDATGKFKSTTPTHLSRAVSRLRKTTFSKVDDAKNILRKEQDVKDYFWNLIEKKKFKIPEDKAAAINSLLS